MKKEVNCSVMHCSQSEHRETTNVSKINANEAKVNTCTDKVLDVADT